VAGRTAVGLDIGTSCVRAAQVTLVKGAVVLDRFGQVALPPGVVVDGEVADPAMLADALKTLWQRAKFTKKDVVLGISNQKVVVRLAQVPWMQESELRESLPFQVADLIPWPIEEAVLDYVPLDEITTDSGRQVRGLLVAASQDMVMSSVRACQMAGLRVRTADLTPFALMRAAGTNDPMGVGAPEAVVDVGARITNIVVHQGGVPKFVRILVLGGDDVTGAVVERLGMTPGEVEALKRDPAALAAASPDVRRIIDNAITEFVDEVRGSITYYLNTTGSQGLSRIVLSGGGSLSDGLAQRLATSTRTPVEYGRVLSSVQVGKTGLSPEQLQYVEPLAAVPVGLAMGAV
jgi:type IV pilus assembly protein PilM